MEPVVKFEAGRALCISGATHAGKSWLAKQIIKHKESMFTRKVESVLYCYDLYNEGLDELLNYSNVELHHGIPQRTKLESYNDGNFHLIILDDLGLDVIRNKEMAKLFTQLCHHWGLSTILIVQNFHSQGPWARDISLQLGAIVLFKNRRDESQVNVLARQMYPGNSYLLTEAYRLATERDYGYLVADCSQSCPELARLRTNVLPGELMVVFY